MLLPRQQTANEVLLVLVFDIFGGCSTRRP